MSIRRSIAMLHEFQDLENILAQFTVTRRERTKWEPLSQIRESVSASRCTRLQRSRPRPTPSNRHSFATLDTCPIRAQFDWIRARSHRNYTLVISTRREKSFDFAFEPFEDVPFSSLPHFLKRIFNFYEKIRSCVVFRHSTKKSSVRFFLFFWNFLLEDRFFDDDYIQDLIRLRTRVFDSFFFLREFSFRKDFLTTRLCILYLRFDSTKKSNIRLFFSYKIVF